MWSQQRRLIYFPSPGPVPPAVLVLRSPVTSLADVGTVHYPWLPVRLLLLDRYPSFERIERRGNLTTSVVGGRQLVILVR
jgi:uncharacterized protein